VARRKGSIPVCATTRLDPSASGPRGWRPGGRRTFDVSRGALLRGGTAEGFDSRMRYQLTKRHRNLHHEGGVREDPGTADQRDGDSRLRA